MFYVCSLFLAYSPSTEMLTTFVATTPSLSLAPSVIDSFSYSLCSGAKIMRLSASQVLTVLSCNHTQGGNMSRKLHQ